MQIIETLTGDPLQNQTFVLTDGSELKIEFYYRPRQYGWFMNSLIYGDFTLNGVRIVNSPNILYQYKNIIPIGLACISTQKREPTLQGDFVSKASILYILDSTEVQEYSEFLSNG